MGRAATAFLAVLAVVCTAIDARAVPGAACPSRKVKGAAKQVESLLKCHDRAAVRGTTVDPICLGKVADKFAAFFASAEKTPPCFATGDAPAIAAAVEAFADGVAASLRPTLAASRCASLKLKASGKKAAKRLVCHQRAIQQGDVVDPQCLATESAKFSARVADAEELPDCLTTGDAGATETAIDAFVDAISAVLRPLTQSHCTERKFIVAGQIGRRKLLCHADAARLGLPVDAECLADEEDDFYQDFAQSEGIQDCFTTGDAVAVDGLVDALVEAVQAQLRPTSTPSHCTTVKIVLAGRVYERLLDCLSDAVEDGVPVIPQCIAGADDSITEGFPFQEAEDIDCLTTGDAAAALATVVSGASAVESALLP